MNPIPVELHNDLISQLYQARGYNTDEAQDAAEVCASATWHGNQTHNAIKALHLDDLFGSKVGGCLPGVEIEVIPKRFPACETWNSNRKLGQSVARKAFDRAIELAEQYGTGIVSVDNTFHYLWGAGYVIEAAKKGYIAYTNCTSSTTEVVPFLGKRPTLGTNPHSWAFPTTDFLGFPLCIDWATSTVAMGRVQQLAREGKKLPPNAAVDKHGNPTDEPTEVAALLPFGGHKGYGMCLINEIIGALIGIGLPSYRGRDPKETKEKTSSHFFFQIIHPEALAANQYSNGRSQMSNLQAVLDDIMDGNEHAILPGQLEANAAAKSEAANALLFTDAELGELHQLAVSIGYSKADLLKN